MLNGDSVQEYNYIKENGVKYYWDAEKNQWFNIVNGERYYPPGYTEKFGGSYSRH